MIKICYKNLIKGCPLEVRQPKKKYVDENFNRLINRFKLRKEKNELDTFNQKLRKKISINSSRHDIFAPGLFNPSIHRNVLINISSCIQLLLIIILLKSI